MTHRESGGTDHRAHAVVLRGLVPGPQVDADRQRRHGPAPGLRGNPHAVTELARDNNDNDDDNDIDGDDAGIECKRRRATSGTRRTWFDRRYVRAHTKVAASPRPLAGAGRKKNGEHDKRLQQYRTAVQSASVKCC